MGRWSLGTSRPLKELRQQDISLDPTAEFFIIHESKKWCSCNMASFGCHCFAMRDVLLGCLNSMLDHCIISMFLHHTCFVTQDIYLNIDKFHHLWSLKFYRKRSSSPGTSHLQPFHLIQRATNKQTKNPAGTKALAAPCEASRRRQCSRTWTSVNMENLPPSSWKLKWSNHLARVEIYIYIYISYHLVQKNNLNQRLIWDTNNINHRHQDFFFTRRNAWRSGRMWEKHVSKNWVFSLFPFQPWVLLKFWGGFPSQ